MSVYCEEAVIVWIFLSVLISTCRCGYRQCLMVSIPTFYDDTSNASTTLTNLRDVRQILSTDLANQDETLEESLFETGSMIDNVIIKYGQTPLDDTSMIAIATELIRMVEVMLDVISFLTCTADNPTSCSIDSTKSLAYVNSTEEKLLQFMTLVINTPTSSNEIEIQQGNIVIATIKSKGTQLDEMVTKYSSTLDIPYVRPDSVQYNDTELLVYVLSYHQNKYTYVENQRMINTGTTRTVIRDEDGDFIDLYGGDDQLEMIVDTKDIMDDPSFWENITNVQSNNDFFLNASFQNNVDGALMNVRIKSIMPCVVKGYDAGLNTSIDSQSPVLDLLLTKGKEIIVFSKPTNLKITYNRQDLSLTFIPPDDNGEPMVSLDMYFQCDACLAMSQMSFLIVRSRLTESDDIDVAIKFIKKMIDVVKNTEFSLHIFDISFETLISFEDGVTVGSQVNGYTTGISDAATPIPTTTASPTTVDINSTAPSGSTNIFTSTTMNPNATVQLPPLRIDTALYNLSSYLTNNASWSRQQFVMVITDGQYDGLNDSMLSSALQNLRDSNVSILAAGYGLRSRDNIKSLVFTPSSWYTYWLTRDPVEVIETSDVQDFVSAICYGDYGDLAFNVWRFGRVSALMLNETTNRWHISENIKMRDISMASATVTFKSNFLGTFGSNVFVIPPDVISFDTLFVDFARKLEETPYVLAVNVSCLCIVVILVVVLRYFDNRDSLKWDYLPLTNNPRRARYSYYLSFYTGFWSSGHLSSTPFIILKGTDGVTGARAVKDGKRKMFERWTLGNFLLTTDRDLGQLLEIIVWHDEKGDSPSWYLEKVLIYDEFNDKKYAFLCGQWLAPDREDCKTKRTLYAAETELDDGGVLFGSNTRFNLFDDYLWLSLLSRPSASRFTRVQRCVCVFSMLFLSMLANAMWYRTAEGVQTYGITIGPFSLTYKNIYVGCMASLVTFVPGFLIAWIFRNRKVKVGKSFKDQSTKEVMNEGFLPWWFIIIGYVIAIICMASGATFTFFYSIEWGKDTTLAWLGSFTFGTIQGILFLDPLKVVFLTLMIAFFCKKYAKKDLQCMAPVLVGNDAEEDMAEHDVNFSVDDEECDYQDKTTEHDKKARARLYKLAQLDRKLLLTARALMIQAAYITILAIICAHNSVWTSYLQNKALETRLTSVKRLNTTDDIWAWLRGQFVDAVHPKLFYNGDVRLNESRNYMSDDVSYRMGLIRIRQLRVKGKCDVPSQLQSVIHACPPDYSTDNTETSDFCEGWTMYNPKKCAGSEWAYKDEDSIMSMSIYGEHDIYSGGGYVKILDQKVKEVRNDLFAMQAYDWIDRFTRLVVIEFVIFNPDSKLFSLPTVTIEMPETGGYYPTVRIKTARLYPYIDSFDYLVLGLQLVFLLITFCRSLHLMYTTWQIGRRCLAQISQWVYLISIVTSLAAIVFYVLRIDRTIYTIEKLFNSKEEFVTFDIVDVMDTAYKVCVSAELFVAVMNLLRPLTFNHNIYLMRTSISISSKDILSFGLCIMVPMVGFAMLCFVFVGPYQMEFRNFVASFITLFRTLLAMVKIKDTFGEHDIGISFAFSVFLFVMTILMVNFCISILNDAFTYVKNNKPMPEDIDVYDMELHKHFWRKINDILKIFEQEQGPAKTGQEDDGVEVLGLSTTLDNQIFKLVSHWERAYLNELNFKTKYNDMLQKLPPKYQKKTNPFDDVPEEPCIEDQTDFHDCDEPFDFSFHSDVGHQKAYFSNEYLNS
ncbi:polycystin-1-like protein 2 [Argopecten irradians]|uniref:polycystin-1-like protein 2 n=1 Tax=Argopecten irradians TaxID=31199 RepID=UPI00371DCF04